MTIGELLVVASFALAASALQAIAGFGFALIAVPAMATVIEPQVAVVVCTVLGTLTSGAQAVLERRHTDRAIARRLILWAASGVPIGLMVFLTVSDRVLRILLAIGVALAVVALGRGIDLRGAGPKLERLMGFVSGVLSTSLGTNGPPLVFGLQARQLPAGPFRGTLATVFAVSGVMGLVAFGLSGSISDSVLAGAAVSLPAIAVGVAAGRRLQRHVSPTVFRRLVLVLMTVAACSALVAALTQS